MSLLLVLFLLFAEGEHDFSPSKTPSAESRQSDGEVSGCNVSASALADFANGENYSFSNLIQFVSSKKCQGPEGISIQKQAIANIKFNEEAPYNLKVYSNSVTSNPASYQSIENRLLKNIPVAFRQNPLNFKESLPLLGQISALSPKAGRKAIVSILQTEMLKQREVSSQNSKEMADMLIKLGTNTESISEEFSKNVENLALETQEDSLKSIFYNLTSAIIFEPSLSSVYNASASALNKGVQRGLSFYSPQKEQKMLKAVFSILQRTGENIEGIDPGVESINKTLDLLFKGQSLEKSGLKGFWKEINILLSRNAHLDSLASAIALSLTPEFIFLSEEDKKGLFLSSNHYRSISYSLQKQSLLAHKKMKENSEVKKLSLENYQKITQKYLKPTVLNILELGSDKIEYAWLNYFSKQKIFDDKDIETHFSPLLLSYVEHMDKASQIAIVDNGFESLTQSTLTNFYSLWTISSVPVPQLYDWLKRH